MADPIDIDAVRTAWERLDAACAGLLASQCKGHRPYMVCPMDCGDVANALDPEFAEARPLIAAVIEECHGRRFDPNLVAEIKQLRAGLAEWERLARDQRAVIASMDKWPREGSSQKCGWCVEVAGNDQAAWDAAMKYTFEEARAHATVCPHSPLVRELAEAHEALTAARAENERDAAIARAETILGDRDLGIRRIAELTARAEKAERDPDPRLACLAADLRNALAELRDRRAADLTDDDRRGLRYLEQLLADRGCKCGACGAAPAKSVLDKLIGGKS